MANASIKNAKRKLSAIDEMPLKKMERKMDCIYTDGAYKYGALEIGAHSDQTKEIKDGRMNLPLVTKHMLLAITNNAPTVVNYVHIVDYCISGKISPCNILIAFLSFVFV